MTSAPFPGHKPVILVGSMVSVGLAGLAAALAHPPWGMLIGLLGYGMLMRELDRLGGPRRWPAALLLGWISGMGYFVPSLLWLAHPFEVDREAQGWMAPFAVILMSAILATFWAVAAATYRFLARREPSRILLFAASMIGLEWLRGHLFTGFPWDLVGESWRAGSWPSQAAAWVGAYGLGWLTLVVASAPFVVFEGRPGRRVASLGLAVLVGLYVVGWFRLAHAPAVTENGPLVRIVQANVKQESKYDARLFASIVSRYLELSARPVQGAPGRRPDIIVWPEGAIPAAFEDYLGEGSWTRDAISKVVSPGQTLILGGYRYGALVNGEPIAFNSLAAFTPVAGRLTLVGLYDKFRLVPFGEYMPFDSVATRWGVKQFVHVGDGFTPGPQPAPLTAPGLPTLQPLICYESLFPGLTREGARHTGVRAAWIANISNDAWFGANIGPRQHLNLASYRAIEEGLPMVRATPTGISAMIDPYGRILPGARLSQGAYGVIDARLPAALKPTVYNRWGDAPLTAMLIVSLIGASAPARLRRGR